MKGERKMFTGSLVAIVTPFKDDGFDRKAYAGLIEFHAKNGTNGIVPCGTTGESATLTPEEHKEVIEFTIDKVSGRMPVVAGTGSNSTKEAIHLTKHAEKNGADAALLIAPYYNRPTQDGLYAHFKAIADEVSIPLILYNIPSRTGVNMEPSTIARLAEHKNIVGIKEASGSLGQMQDIIALCPDDFILLSGDDGLLLPVLSIGGKGVISVVANIVPAMVIDLIKTYEKGDMKRALKLNYGLLSLTKSMFLETNPVPVKTALSMMGMMKNEIRLPLAPMRKENITKLAACLRQAKLIKK